MFPVPPLPPAWPPTRAPWALTNCCGDTCEPHAAIAAQAAMARTIFSGRERVDTLGLLAIR
jgi:hypothetical protein